MAGMRTSTPSRRPQLAIAATALLAAGALLTACSGTDSAAAPAPSGSADSDLAALVPAEIADSGVLSLGALWETPPMIGVSESDTNVPVGIAPELAAVVAVTLGLTPEWQNMQWPAQLPGVLSGQVDALWGQVTGTAERESADYDQIPFYRNTESLLVLADEAQGIEGLSSMCGMTVGVPIGSTQGQEVASASEEFCVAEGEPAIATAEYQGATAAISAVQAGTVDAWMDNTTNQLAAAEASGSTFEAVEIPEDEVPATYTTITVSKQYPGLSEALAGALKAAVEDGSYQAILDSYDVGAAALTADEIVINPYTGLAAGATS